MKSNAKTIYQFLSEFPRDKQAELVKVREAVLSNIPKNCQEIIKDGVVCYSTSHDSNHPDICLIAGDDNFELQIKGAGEPDKSVKFKKFEDIPQGFISNSLKKSQL